MGRRIRILLAKPGLDGHDRGVKIVAMALRDAGIEVIYTGRRQTAEQIVRAAIEEDVDAIGLSSLSGAHDVLFPRIMELLKQKKDCDILVFGGGIIPKDDAVKLKGLGIVEIFGPGSPTKTIVGRIKKEIQTKRGKSCSAR